MINKGAICQKYFCQIFLPQEEDLDASEHAYLPLVVAWRPGGYVMGVFPKGELAQMESGLWRRIPGAWLIQINEAPLGRELYLLLVVVLFIACIRCSSCWGMTVSLPYPSSSLWPRPKQAMQPT